MRSLFGTAGLLVATLLIASSDTTLSLRLSTEAHPSYGSGSPLFFAGEEAVVTLTLGYFDVSESGRTVAKPYPLPDDWWKSIRWTIETAGGTPVPLPSEIEPLGDVTLAKAIPLNDTVQARFSFGALPTGDYRVSVALPGVPRPATVLFRVRQGDEEPKVRIAALRASLRSGPSFPQAKAILDELTKLDPENPEHHETLGVLSVGRGALPEGAAHFRTAQTIAATNLRAFQSENPSIDCVEFELRVGDLGALADMLNRLSTSDVDVELQPEPVGNRTRYTLIDRSTGRVLWRR